MKNSSPLTTSERERYSRHLKITEIGEKGQQALKESSVLVIGAGGLGSASSIYLAAAGIGKLGILDSDVVELSNLQRQILHGTSNLGAKKTTSAKQRLLDINNEIQVVEYPVRFNQQVGYEISKEYSIVLDATDNFETRYLINQICVQQHKPFIFASVYQFYGQMSIFDAKTGPCFRCVFKEFPPVEIINTNREVGVCSPLPGIMGTLQALETIKLITKSGKPCKGQLLLFDGLEMKMQNIHIKKDPQCSDCGLLEKNDHI